MEKQDKKGWVDTVLAKAVSRKLLVWGTATGAFFAGTMTSEHWLWLSLAYIGSQGAADIVARLKGSSK